LDRFDSRKTAVHISNVSGDPFYQQIKDALRGQITSGRLKPGACIPDERSLAELLRVSRQTTRRAIMDLTEEGLLRRIRGRGTYVRDSIAPVSNIQQTSIVIASETNPFDHPYYAKIVRGAYEMAASSNLFTSVETLCEPYDRFLANLRRHRTAKGVIVIGGRDSELLQQLLRLEVPVVLVDSHQPPEKPLFDLVTYDAEAGMYTAVKALIDLGHTQIGFMRSMQLRATMALRHDGYIRAMKEAGLFRPELIVKAKFSSQAAYDAMSEILRGANVPTAMACIGDDMAIGVIDAVKDYGCSVPQDMSVLGFGDLNFFTSPALSTVSAPKEHMGAAAVRMLEMRNANPSSPLQRQVLPVELMMRGTCIAPRGNDTLKRSEMTP
jgi:DNA-binding LacI/PurR family transcriptional regulator